MRSIVVVLVLAMVMAGVPAMMPQLASAADNELFQQMDIGFFSIGGRATYYDSKEGQDRWFGGGQVRLYPLKYTHTRFRFLH